MINYDVIYDLVGLLVPEFTFYVDIRLILAVAAIPGYIHWEIKTSRKHR